MPTHPAMPPSAAPARAGFRIPDLCSARPVLVLCLISVLLALLLVLYAGGLGRFDWAALGDTAVVIVSNVLLCAALLCAIRARLATWPLVIGAGTAYAVILLVCASIHGFLMLLFGSVLGTSGPASLWRDLLMAALLGGAALRYFHLQGELIERERAELDARIRSLQARIRPHFLFNSMNIIASLIPVAPEQAEHAVEDLAELFRASLREGDRTVPLAEELELCARYMRLEQWRLGERLVFERHADAAYTEARVPPLCLQPLLENAVYHGIQPRPEGGAVELLIHGTAGRLVIEVLNPLAPTVGPAGSGMAIANIRARLAAIYGDAARLDAGPDGGRFRARLELPRLPP